MPAARPAAARSPTAQASSAAASCDLRGVDKVSKDRRGWGDCWFVPEGSGALRALLSVPERSGWRPSSCTYRIEELIPRGHQANARRTQRMKGHRVQPGRRKQRERRFLAKGKRRRMLPKQTGHCDPRPVIPETKSRRRVTAAHMRQRVERHADITRPLVLYAHAGQIRKELDHGALQRIKARRLSFLAERITAAEQHAAIDLAKQIGR